MAHLENVSACGVDDWRASIAYVEKIAPDRYGKQAVANQGITIKAQDSAVTVLIQKVYGDNAQKARITGATPAQVCDVPVQALPEPKADQPK